MALFRRQPKEGKRVLRKDRRGAKPVVVGAVVLAIVSIATWFGFSKDLPFSTGFKMEAVFENANSIRANSPVRIAGVNVGKVKAIERQPGTNASIVTFEIQEKGLPIHKDATAKIRPRIFLEGNFFVDLKPGTPGAPTIDDGDTLPMTQTSAPVQLGDVLTALQDDTRSDLQDLLVGYGGALLRQPSVKDDADADPDARGDTAAASLNDSIDDAAPALRGVSIVNEAFLGIDQHDLSGLIQSLARITTSLEKNESQLQDFVTNFNATMKIFADEKTNLRSTIRELAPTLEQTNTTLFNLNAALPPTRAFAREILPGVRETPATIEASFPFIRETRKLLGQNELRGLVQELSPATRDLARATDATVSLLPETDLVSKCVSRVILPTGDIKIQDGALSTGKENYKEFWYTMVGLAGEGQNQDGNGMYVRFQPGGGTQTLSTGTATFSGEQLFGRNDLKPIGTRPAYTGKRPPYKPDEPCFEQKIPDLNGAATAAPDASKQGNPSGGTGTTPTTIPIPGTPLSPTIPQLPSLGSPTATRGADAAPAPATDDVAGQLLDRLNPFREGEGK